MKTNPSENALTNRKPSVANQFYPGTKRELIDFLKSMFYDANSSVNLKNVRAIISPHAGYVFSGRIAASSFNQIDATLNYDNIFIIGSSHHIYFDGASIYNIGNYDMPMGEVKVNIELANKLINENSCFQFRSDAHYPEHSIEVQLPFLQYIMKKDFEIVPIIIATQSYNTIKDIAKALTPYFNNSNNLFIFSTDFSHYPSYEDANKIDSITAKAVCTNNPEILRKALNSNSELNIPNLATSMCGWSSILTLMNITYEMPEIEYHKIMYKNSGDSPFGDYLRVVGYCSIVVNSNKEQSEINEQDFNLTEKDKETLLNLARTTIEKYVVSNKILKLSDKDFSDNLKTAAGAFVTLHKDGKLRGCIGRFSPNEPLYRVVQDMAISAATRDYRFSPVSKDEVNKLQIEISVLTPMKKINSTDEIELGKHGIYIVKDGHSGTFLPQVATETGWTLDEFIGHCSRDKAGIGWDGWKNADVFIYEALIFSEE